MVALCNFGNAFAPQKLGGMPYTVLIRTVYLVFMVSYHQHISKDCETQFWYILIREWSYAGISHDQSTPGDGFPSPNTQKNDDYEPSMWNSFFPKLIRDQHESQVDITGSPCHLACSSLSIVFKSKE